MRSSKREQLRRVGKQLIRIIKKYSPNKDEALDATTHVTIMRELGFRRSRNGTNGAWINKQRGYVVKSPYLCSFEDGTEVPKKAIPTIVIGDKSLGQIWIQPLADTSTEAVRKARKIIVKGERKWDPEMFMRHWGKDAHTQNIGLYKSKPVVFDW